MKNKILAPILTFVFVSSVSFALNISELKRDTVDTFDLNQELVLRLDSTLRPGATYGIAIKRFQNGSELADPPAGKLLGFGTDASKPYCYYAAYITPNQPDGLTMIYAKNSSFEFDKLRIKEKADTLHKGEDGKYSFELPLIAQSTPQSVRYPKDKERAGVPGIFELICNNFDHDPTLDEVNSVIGKPLFSVTKTSVRSQGNKTDKKGH